MNDFLAALGLALAIEGMIYALFPGGMKAMMAQLQAVPEPVLRLGGLAAAVLGVAWVWLIRN